MATSLKKAGSALRKSIRSKRYTMFEAKENNCVDSPSKFTKKVTEEEDKKEQEMDTTTSTSSSTLQKTNRMRQSMRQAVGTIRHKLRMSTRKHHVRLSEVPTPKRRHSIGGVRKGKDVKMSSPFRIETPGRSSDRNRIKTCLSMETPTRLRREVEELTSNMTALSTLTPNTLQARRTRRSPPMTNGSLKTSAATRKRIQTDIY